MYCLPLGIHTVILPASAVICCQIDGTGHGLGSYKTKGCYAYNSKGMHPGHVYFSAGGTAAEMEAAPSSVKKFRLPGLTIEEVTSKVRGV